jgi:hypothetical protein
MGRSILSGLASIAALWLPTAGRTQSQQLAGGHLLQGTWALVSSRRDAADGSQRVGPVHRADAKGLVTVDHQGRHSLQPVRQDRPLSAQTDGPGAATGSHVRHTVLLSQLAPWPGWRRHQAAVAGISTHIRHIAVDWVNPTVSIVSWSPEGCELVPESRHYLQSPPQTHQP